MKWDGKDLAHVLPGFAVYFALRSNPDRTQLLSVLNLLRAAAHGSGTIAEVDEHVAALESRMTGRFRWDSVSPRFLGETKTVEGWREAATRVQTIDNMVRLRGYSAYTIEGLRYTLDMFNPRNELGVNYAEAGEPVVALIFAGLEREPGPVSLRLFENEFFYRLLIEIDRILEPDRVCGTWSMMSILMAYLQERIDPSFRPWDFLFPLHVLENPPVVLSPGMKVSAGIVGMQPGKTFTPARVEKWPRERLLLQTRPGLEPSISWEYFAMAKTLGMISVQELVEGRVPARP